MSGRPHPAEKALSLWRTGRVVEKRREPTKRYLSPQEKDGQVFSRLIKSYNLLRDPAEEVIYPGLRRKRPRLTPSDKREAHVIRNDPITVPTCCMLHQQEVEQLIEDHRGYLYNSPTPPLPAISHTGERDRLERLSDANLCNNSRRQLPVSTVMVRWRNYSRSPSTRAYDTETLYDIMSEFGPITSIYTISPCSAYVVFLNLSDSCDAITTGPLGRPDNRLYCYWLHKNMVNKLFYLTRAGIRVNHDQFILPSK